MKNIIIEGLDGTGKSTLSAYLEQKGYTSLHCEYSNREKNVFKKYKHLLLTASNLVFDRSFISEIVYGSILRGSIRIRSEEIIELLSICSNNNYILIYLYASKAELLKRVNNSADYNLLLKYYDLLSNEYQKVINRIKAHIRVIELCTDQEDYLTNLLE